MILPFWTTYIGAWGILIATLSILWFVSVWRKDASIVDPFWGLCFVIAGWFYFSQSPGGNPSRKWLLMTLVTIWGLRLSLYLIWRNWGKGEDFRYQNFRQRYGKARYWWVSLFQVFWLQATLAWIVSSTLLGGQFRGGPLNLLDIVGVLIWGIGFAFEAGGDWQLARFKKEPKNNGRVLDSGFWRYTRHPNYFGDSACWWGYGLIAMAAGSYFAITGAILMTLLIIRISGVAILDSALPKSKPGYATYMAQTSAFLPWTKKVTEKIGGPS